jgi:hypothetical protein
MRILIAFIAAALAPAFAITAYYLFGQLDTFEPGDPYIWVRTGNFLWLCILISTIHVITFGIPTYYFLLKLKVIRFWSVIGAGFILGAAPTAIATWPLQYSGQRASASANGIQTMIDGIPTMEGWLAYMHGISFFGICGMASALVFWLIAPNKALKPLATLTGTASRGPLA